MNRLDGYYSYAARTGCNPPSFGDNNGKNTLLSPIFGGKKMCPLPHFQNTRLPRAPVSNQDTFQ